jgi:hypothetical protein
MSVLLGRRTFLALARHGSTAWPQRMAMSGTEPLKNASLQKRQFSANTYIHKVPMMGDSITEGTISSWLKNVGENVAEDETFVTIETDKVCYLSV